MEKFSKKRCSRTFKNSPQKKFSAIVRILEQIKLNKEISK